MFYLVFRIEFVGLEDHINLMWQTHYQASSLCQFFEKVCTTALVTLLLLSDCFCD